MFSTNDLKFFSGFSCSAVNSTILNDSDDVELIEADSCGETVGEIIGL